MGRKLGYMMLVMALAVPASASGKPGTISGFVRNSAGTPQMGAMVEVFARATQPLTVFTDAKGHYSASGLEPGTYYVKVSAPTFLPAMRENVSLRSGAAVLVNVTLSTLFEAIQMLPARRSTADDEGWKWTLRSVANRPILRVVDGGPILVEQENERVLKARVAFVAGGVADGFGSAGEMSTNFALEHSLFTTGTLSFSGNVGYGGGPQSGVLRATYSHRMSDGSIPELSLSVRRFANPDINDRVPALQALSMKASDSMTFADVIGLHLGAEYQMVQFVGHASAVKPFGSVDVHFSPNTVLSYQFASAEPNMVGGKGFDSAAMDLGQSGPRISMVERNAVLEKARHQEVALSQRVGNSSFQVAGYFDRIRNTALTGVGDLDSPMAELLPDLYSGTFTYDGGELNTEGVRFVAEHKFSPGLTATVSYAYGGVLDVNRNDLGLHGLREMVHQDSRHALGMKLSGTAPATHTQWAASYRLTNQKSLTPVDLFDASPGRVDPYLNFFIRQPLPATGFLPGKMEALVDLRNLLAQGYVPVIGHDGRTLYLVQSARSIRGGLAFVF
jgi:hypothetical protein